LIGFSVLQALQEFSYPPAIVQASIADSVVEPVTPVEGATGVAYEEGDGWVIFFDGSEDEGFLWTDES
jgi:hypothetical protein